MIRRGLGMKIVMEEKRREKGSGKRDGGGRVAVCVSKARLGLARLSSLSAPKLDEYNLDECFPN